MTTLQLNNACPFPVYISVVEYMQNDGGDDDADVNLISAFVKSGRQTKDACRFWYNATLSNPSTNSLSIKKYTLQSQSSGSTPHPRQAIVFFFLSEQRGFDDMLIAPVGLSENERKNNTSISFGGVIPTPAKESRVYSDRGNISYIRFKNDFLFPVDVVMADGIRVASVPAGTTIQSRGPYDRDGFSTNTPIFIVAFPSKKIISSFVVNEPSPVECMIGTAVVV